MTWTPVRSGALRGSVAVSLALLAWLAIPAGASAGRAYVSNEDDGTVTVIDTQRRAAIATIAVGKRPRGLVLSHDGAHLYVAVSGLPKCPPPIPEEKCAKLPRDLQVHGVPEVPAADPGREVRQAAAGPAGRRRGGHRYRDAQADANAEGGLRS